MRYEQREGIYVPRCGGRCLTPSISEGSDNLVWLSVALIVGPCAGCGIYVIDDFRNDVTKVLLWIILALMNFLSMSFLAAAHVVEPGILKTERDVETGINKIVAGQQRVDLREFRAKFCRETNTCVEKFDHYCPWVGNAVGARNYPYFYAFVVSAVIIALYVNAISWACIVDGMEDSGWDGFRESSSDRVSSVILIVYTVIIALCISPLCAYHTWLISVNQTTNENLKVVYVDKSSNPFDKGCVGNWLSFCSSLKRLKPSHLKVEVAPAPTTISEPAATTASHVGE